MIKTGKVKAFYFSTNLILGFSTATLAAEVRVEVNPKTAAVGQLVQATLTVTSEQSISVDDPRAPDFDGFELVGQSSGMGMSQRPVQTPQGMKIKNIYSKTFRYNLMPTRVGQLSIGSFDVVVDGKGFRSEPQLIRIIGAGQNSMGKGGAGPQGPNAKKAPRNPDPFAEEENPFGANADPFDQIQKMEEEMFNNLLSRRQRQLLDDPRPEPQYRSGVPVNTNEAFFVQVEVDKTEVYEWEPVIVTWYVYTRGRMETMDRVKYPDMRGFFKEIIEENPTIQFMDEIINGVPFKRAMIGTYALFPMKAGKSYIDEYKIKSKVALPSAFGYSKAYEFTRSSKKVEITVKALPAEGRPQDFAGAVGNFDVQSGVDNNKHPAHQPMSFRIRVEGTGNAKAVELPAINWPEGIEVFDTRNESKFFKNGKSFKEFEVLLIPRKEGEMTLPAVSLSFFDPRTKKYYTRATQPVSVLITPGNPDAAAANRISGATPSAGKSTVPIEKTLPAPIVSLESSVAVGLGTRIGFWVGLLGLLIGSLILKARKELNWGVRRQSQGEKLEKRLKAASKACQFDTAKPHGAEMLNIYYQALGQSNLDNNAVEITKLLEQAPASLRRDFGARILKSVEFYQAICFAPEDLTKELRKTESLQKQYAESQILVKVILKAGQSK